MGLNLVFPTNTEFNKAVNFEMVSDLIAWLESIKNIANPSLTEIATRRVVSLLIRRGGLNPELLKLDKSILIRMAFEKAYNRVVLVR
jgi:hypothetical protein